MSWGSSVSIVPGCGLNDRMIGVQFPEGSGNFSLQHCIHTGSEAHPASYATSTGGSLPGAGA
jgi:hypothetical protein